MSRFLVYLGCADHSASSESLVSVTLHLACVSAFSSRRASLYHFMTPPSSSPPSCDACPPFPILNTYPLRCDDSFESDEGMTQNFRRNLIHLHLVPPAIPEPLSLPPLHTLYLALLVVPRVVGICILTQMHPAPSLLHLCVFNVAFWINRSRDRFPSLLPSFDPPPPSPSLNPY